MSLLFNILSRLVIILWRESKGLTGGGWEGRGIGVVGKAPEKAMAPHSSTLGWKIPMMEEPGRLQSMGSLKVGHD